MNSDNFILINWSHKLPLHIQVDMCTQNIFSYIVTMVNQLSDRESSAMPELNKEQV